MKRTSASLSPVTAVAKSIFLCDRCGRTNPTFAPAQPQSFSSGASSSEACTKQPLGGREVLDSPASSQSSSCVSQLGDVSGSPPLPPPKNPSHVACICVWNGSFSSSSANISIDFLVTQLIFSDFLFCSQIGNQTSLLVSSVSPRASVLSTITLREHLVLPAPSQ